MEIIEKMENIIKHYLNNNRPIIIIGEVSSRRTFLVKKAIKELGEQMNFINYNTELTLDGIIENKINVEYIQISKNKWNALGMMEIQAKHFEIADWRIKKLLGNEIKRK